MGRVADFFRAAPPPPSETQVALDAQGQAQLASAPLGRGREQGKHAQERQQAAQFRANEMWEIYDQIGDIATGVRKQGRIAGHAALGIYEWDEHGRRKLVKQTSSLSAELKAIGSALHSPVGGQRGLIERFWSLYKIAGFMEVQAYGLIDGRSGKVSGLQFRSADEVDRSQEKVRLKRFPFGRLAPTTAEGYTSEARDPESLTGSIVGQVWQPHPRFFELAESPLWSMRKACKQYIALEDSVTTRIHQRAAMSGIHWWPSELTEVHLPPTAPPELRHATTSNLAKLVWMVNQMAMNPGSPEALAGIHISASKESIQAYRFEDGFRALLEADIELMEKLHGRIMRAFDINEGTVIGRTEANHFSAWADDADEQRSNILPGLQSMCIGLAHVLFRNLGETERQRYHIWFSHADAQAMVNRQDNLRRAVDAGVASPATQADELGLNADQRATTDDAIRRAGDRLNDPVLSLHNLPGIPDHIQERINQYPVGKSGPGGNVNDSSRTPSQPGKGDPGSPGDDRSDRPGSSTDVD